VEIERVGNGVVWKLDERSGPSEPESAQRQAVAAERRSSRRQRPSDVAVDDAHAVATGTGNAALRVDDGRSTVNALENVDAVDVDGAQATDEVTNCARSDDVYNRSHVPC